MTIYVSKLHKSFVSYERGEGTVEAIKSLFNRKKKIFHAVNGISFQIKEGEVVGFLGPNGAGKSTTLKILSGIMYPDSGEVNILGYTPWKQRKEYVGNIGAVFGQKSQLYWDLPPIDAFAMHKSIYRLDEERYKVQRDKLISLLDLKSISRRPTRQLSLGERMRCEFAIAMLHEPKIIFLDEPTIGLDIFAKEKIRKFVMRINKTENKTFIITSHDLQDIENLCSRLIIINHGKMVFNDTIDKLSLVRKKHLTVTYDKAINPKELAKVPGIKIVKIISDRVVLVEIELSAKYLDEVIKEIRLGRKIADLEITDIPINKMIKKFYE